MKKRIGKKKYGKNTHEFYGKLFNQRLDFLDIHNGGIVAILLHV